ncbi:hypothetical protein RSOCI_04485 [Rhabdochlamydiaceae symbiont of Dictyostelium giganteum]
MDKEEGGGFLCYGEYLVGPDLVYFSIEKSK